jgi:phospholipid/cholesterol/gamma-HCH transport system substrate-binding protein
MEPKVHYLLAGSFVVVLGLIALGLVVWLGKADYRGVYNRYETYMRQSVSGLSVNSTVKYRGVDVGRVKAISLNPENTEEVRLTLDILQGTPIKTDTVATLQTQGLTGLATLNLEGGSREAPSLVLEPGQEYPVIQSRPSLFFRLDMALSRLLSDQSLTKLLKNLNAFTENAMALMTEENRVRLERTLADLSTISRTLAGQSASINHALETASESMDNLAILTSTINEEIPLLLNRISTSAVAVKQVTEELARTGQTVGMVVQDSRPDIERFTGETLGETGLLIAELRELTSTLQRVVQQVEQNPDSLVFGRPAPVRGPGE